MDQPELSPEQEAFLQQQIDRGADYMSMTQTPGWQHVLDRVQTILQVFTTDTLNNGYKTLEDFEFERGKVQGLRDLLRDIESDIKAYQSNLNDKSKTENSGD